MRHIPEAGAVCGNSARTDLRGGRGVNPRSYRNMTNASTQVLAHNPSQLKHRHLRLAEYR